MQRVLCYIIHYFLTFVIHRCTLQIHPHCGQHTETAVSSRCTELQVFHLASLPMTGTPAPCHHQGCSRHPWACVIRDNVGGSLGGRPGTNLPPTVVRHAGFLAWLHQSVILPIIHEKSQISVFCQHLASCNSNVYFWPNSRR